MIKALIVDDNIIARTTIKHLSTQVDGITILGECSNANDALTLLQKQAVNLLFLDVGLPDMTGLELVRKLGDKKPVIIFITSYREDVTEIDQAYVADYIVKPITFSGFVQAVEMAKELLRSTN